MAVSTELPLNQIGRQWKPCSHQTYRRSFHLATRSPLPSPCSVAICGGCAARPVTKCAMKCGRIIVTDFIGDHCDSIVRSGQSLDRDVPSHFVFDCLKCGALALEPAAKRAHRIVQLLGNRLDSWGRRQSIGYALPHTMADHLHRK